MTGRPASRLSPLPYFVAFVAAPLAILAGRLADKEALARSFGLSGLAPWLALSGLAVLTSLYAGVTTRAKSGRALWPVPALGLVLAVAAWLLARGLALVLLQAEDYAPLLDEVRLPALVLFAALWAWSFGAPRRESLARAGAALGALVVLDFLLTAIMARGLVPGGGVLFGDAPATADALGFLLCTALCATVDDLPEAGVPRLARWLILAGLLASGSRVGLAAGALLCLFFERGRLGNRAAMAAACILAIWISLILPLQHGLGGEELGLDWYYSATMEALDQDPRALAVGLPLDVPLALAMPEFQGLVWDAEADGLPVSVFQIPSSTLRLLAGWGVGGPLLVFGAALFCALRGRRRFGFGLALTTVLCATLAPVLHIPATAAALALALLSAARKPDAAQPKAAAQTDPAQAAGATGAGGATTQEPAQAQATEAQEARPTQAPE
ncbi:hypothetical protein [Humidesulfovibrio idahonensis]